MRDCKLRALRNVLNIFGATLHGLCTCVKHTPALHMGFCKSTRTLDPSIHVASTPPKY